MSHDCSNGPVSTMPGSTSKAQANIPCEEEGCLLPSTTRVQGETDSMGCEYIHYCDVHYSGFKLDFQAQAEEARKGTCDWCKLSATDLRNRRDLDEGSAGPVYRVCGSCRTKDNERAAEELNQLYEDDPGFYDRWEADALFDEED